MEKYEPFILKFYLTNENKCDKISLVLVFDAKNENPNESEEITWKRPLIIPSGAKGS